MTHHRAWSVLALLPALAGCSPDPSTTARPRAGQTGAQLYEANCLSCHQSDARGIPSVYPSLVGSPVVRGDPLDLALWVVNGQRPPSMPAGRYATTMPPFGWMKPADAAALFTYLRSSFGNAAPAVDAATVSRALERSP